MWRVIMRSLPQSSLYSQDNQDGRETNPYPPTGCLKKDPGRPDLHPDVSQARTLSPARRYAGWSGHPLTRIYPH